MHFFANQSRKTLLFVVVLTLSILLIPLQARATQSTQNVSTEVVNGDVQIVHSDESGISFKITPPEFEKNSVETEKGLYEQIRIPGYDAMALTGQPDLPQKGFLIALPPGAEPVLNLVTAESHQVSSIKVAPRLDHTLVSYDPDDLQTPPEFESSYRFDENTYSQDTLFPASPVILGQETWLRRQRAVWVIVRPVQANPVQESLTVYSQLEVEVQFEFPNGRPNVETVAPESGAYREILQANLLNYDQSLEWRTKPATAELVLPQTSPCMDNNAFRIVVKETGMYSISHASLTAAYGAFPASTPSAKLRMCYGSQEIQIKVNDGGDSNFNSGDSLVFYGQSLKTQETEENVYWLTYSTNGANGLRMAAETDSSPGTAPAYYIPTFHLETDTKYYSSIPSSDLNDHWYWAAQGQPLVGEATSPYRMMDIPFEMSNKASGVYNFSIRMELWGFLFDELHKFEVKLNGTSIGTGEFTGAGTDDVFYIYEGSAPSSALINGSNTLTLIALDNDANPNNVGHRMLLNWVEVEPRRQFVAQNNRLAFEQPSAGTYSFAGGSFTSGATVDIYNVTDPANPIVQSKTATGGSVSFNRTIAGDARFELAATNAYLSPDSITKDTQPNPLLGIPNNTADMIIITHPSLDSALTPLRTLRTGQGLVVKTVFVQDIFDEFNYGVYDTSAIKDFLDYAYNNWSGDLDYVLLAGDATYDHRDVLGTNGSSNMVPVYLRSGIDNVLGEAAADNQYVDFNGDNLAEMMLGRLPAQNTTELTTMVNKIVAYETGEANPSWRGRHLFVADNPYVPNDCDMDPAGDFFATINSYISSFFPDGHILVRLYYAPSECFPNDSGPYTIMEPYYVPSAAEMRERLKDEFNFGNQFVVYVGHSSTTLWAGENFINTTTVADLTNGNRTPIMLPMTCLEGWYHLSGPANGLSEAMLKHTGGGAVASYSPTGFQVQTGHDYLFGGFYTAVFTNNVQTLGEAVMQAKINLESGPTVYHDLHDTYMLLGDPAMRFNMPETVTQNFLPISLRS